MWIVNTVSLSIQYYPHVKSILPQYCICFIVSSISMFNEFRYGLKAKYMQYSADDVRLRGLECWTTIGAILC